MLRFVLRRFWFLVVVLFGVSLLTFLIANVAPGDPARMAAGPSATPEAVAALRAEWGLDQPLIEQYFRYLGRLAHFDLGTSNVTGRPVLDEILARAPATIELMVAALLLALVVGVPLGVWAALRRGSWVDSLVRGLATLGVSVPAFWLGLLLILLFYRTLGWLPGSGRFMGDPPTAMTGFLTLDALLHGDWAAFRLACAHLVLPVASLALLDLGQVARLVRNQLLAVLSQDYIRVARASGLPERAVVYRHALRNAVSPLITVIAASIAQMLYGSVSIELVFGWPGAGQYVVNSIFNLDFPVIMGFALLTSGVYVVANLGADLAYAWLDPRVRAR